MPTLRELTDELRQQEIALRLGGGEEGQQRQRRHGRLPVRERLALLLDEDFSCASIGCNATHGITNDSYWRWSTTGSAQSSMAIGQAGGERTGNAVSFHVDWCPPPDPNPKHLGCYRSELALQRAVQVLLQLVRALAVVRVRVAQL